MGIDYDKIKNWPIPSSVSAYTRRDTIRYARGIGVGMPGPLQAEEGAFLEDSGALQALPMMAVVLNEGPLWTQDPATNIDWTQTIHAEESLVLHRPLPPEGNVLAQYRVDEIYDKGPGKGALMYESRLLSERDGDLIASLQIATFLRRNGGFGGGGDNGAAPRPHPRPEREPDASIALSTPVGEDAIYCLGAEFVDALGPAHQARGGSMLRGACAFGIAGRGVLKLCCGNDPSRLRRMSLRYAGPTFTGETVRILVWKEGPGQAAFEVRAVERDMVVMKNGYAEYLA